MGNFSSNYFSAKREQTVTKWVYGQGIEAIQLEINATWLNLRGNRQDVHHFSQLLQGLTTFLKYQLE